MKIDQTCRFLLFGVLFSSILASAASCTSRKPLLYQVIDADQHDNYFEQGMYAKYILIEDDFSPELRKALETYASSSPGAKSRSRSDVKLLQIDAERNFFLGVLHLDKREFQTARLYFQSAATGIPQAEILLLDCARELNKPEDYLMAYQEIYDKTKDPLLRKVIKERFEYFRHGL